MFSLIRASYLWTFLSLIVLLVACGGPPQEVLPPAEDEAGTIELTRAVQGYEGPDSELVAFTSASVDSLSSSIVSGGTTQALSTLEKSEEIEIGSGSLTSERLSVELSKPPPEALLPVDDIDGISSEIEEVRLSLAVLALADAPERRVKLTNAPEVFYGQAEPRIDDVLSVFLYSTERASYQLMLNDRFPPVQIDAKSGWNFVEIGVTSVTNEGVPAVEVLPDRGGSLPVTVAEPELPGDLRVTALSVVPDMQVSGGVITMEGEFTNSGDVDRADNVVLIELANAVGDRNLYDVSTRRVISTFSAPPVRSGKTSRFSHEVQLDSSIGEGVYYVLVAAGISPEDALNSTHRFIAPVIITAKEGASVCESVYQAVEIPDRNLREAILEQLGGPLEAGATCADMQRLTRLVAKEAGVVDLEGLQYATNLRYLNLDNNDVSELTPLSGLEKLSDLRLWENDISDIGPLSSSKQLETLILGGNNIAELEPLAGLTELTYLNLWNNRIVDVAPLAALTKLNSLWLIDNNISDISPLAALINLESVSLVDTGVNDLGPLSGLINLKTLYLSSNGLTSIDELSELINLEDLDLSANEISDISPLADLVNLVSLNLLGNNVVDVMALSKLENLEELDLWGNWITDIAPLTQNAGLGAGDSITLNNNCLDLSEGSAADTDVKSLIARGVDIDFTYQRHEEQCR